MEPDVLAQPTFKALLDLVPMFEPKIGQKESWDQAKQDKISDFLDLMVASGPMQPLMTLLNNKGHPYAENNTVLKNALHTIWFDMFARTGNGNLDSSAFEHVFIGEIKKKKVAGMHNWAVIHKFENDAANKLDYRGYIDKLAVRCKPSPHPHRTSLCRPTSCGAVTRRGWAPS